MIMPNHVIDAIGNVIKDKYPNATIYKNSCPDTFPKPCFCIKTVKAFERPASHNTVHIRARFCITAYPAADDNGKVDETNLVDLQANIMAIFGKGYVIIGDRKISVNIKCNGLEIDSCSVALRFDYFDDRIVETNDKPFMTEVNLDLNKEE